MARNVLPFSRKRGRRGSSRLRVPHSAVLWSLLFALAVGLYWLPRGADVPLLTLPKIPIDSTVELSFGLCDDRRGNDCVIDGDTFKYQGQSIRIADIDAPETHPPRCAYEADLGEQATVRLQ